MPNENLSANNQIHSLDDFFILTLHKVNYVRKFVIVILSKVTTE